MVPGASLILHVSPDRIQNPQPVELPAASSQSVPPIVTQEAALSVPGIKGPPSGAAERYRDVLPRPLAGMFTSRSGRPETIEGVKEPDTESY